MDRACPLQQELTQRIEGALRVKMGAVNCRLVNEKGMSVAMRRSGWASKDTRGVIGFQVGKHVYVREDTPWTVLHELIHRSGVNGDRLNRYVAEGLTEAIALELKRSSKEHRPTYPAETAWVQTELLPRLGMTAVQLGSALAKVKNAPRVLADMLTDKDGGLDRVKLERELQPQRPEKPTIGSASCFAPTRYGSTDQPPSLDRRRGIGHLVLQLALVGGAALVLPKAAERFLP